MLFNSLHMVPFYTAQGGFPCMVQLLREITKNPEALAMYKGGTGGFVRKSRASRFLRKFRQVSSFNSDLRSPPGGLLILRAAEMGPVTSINYRFN